MSPSLGALVGLEVAECCGNVEEAICKKMDEEGGSW